jgi:hypothetical protein
LERTKQVKKHNIISIIIKTPKSRPKTHKIDHALKISQLSRHSDMNVLKISQLSRHSDMNVLKISREAETARELERKKAQEAMKFAKGQSSVEICKGNFETIKNDMKAEREKYQKGRASGKRVNTIVYERKMAALETKLGAAQKAWQKAIDEAW